MRVKIVLFANLKDYFESVLELELADGDTAAAVKERLASMEPRARELLANCRVAADEDLIRDEDPIGNARELVVLPPASGG